MYLYLTNKTYPWKSQEDIFDTEDFMMPIDTLTVSQSETVWVWETERGILNILTADLRLALTARRTRYDHNYHHLFPGIQIFLTNKKNMFPLTNGSIKIIYWIFVRHNLWARVFCKFPSINKYCYSGSKVSILNIQDCGVRNIPRLVSILVIKYLQSVISSIRIHELLR